MAGEYDGRRDWRAYDADDEHERPYRPRVAPGKLSRSGAVYGRVFRAADSAAPIEADRERLDAAARGSGQGLPEPLRGELEQAIGADLSGVRVHTDGASGEAAQSIHARAFATGSDIFFAPGTYDPDSEDGRRLIAHEVAHTVQQAGAPAVQAKLEVSQPGDAAEVEADAVADAFAAGQPATITPLSSGGTIARAPVEGHVLLPSDDGELDIELGLPAPPVDPLAEPTGERPPAPRATNELGLTETEMRSVMAALAPVLDEGEVEAGDQEARVGERSSPSAAPESSAADATTVGRDRNAAASEVVTIQVLLDESVTRAKYVRRALQIRIAEGAAAAYGVDLGSRLAYAALVDAASVAGLWSPQHLKVAGVSAPGEAHLRQLLEAQLRRGSQISMNVQGFRAVLDWYEGHQRARAAAIGEFKRQMWSSDMPARLLADLGAMHVNGITSAFNELAAAAYQLNASTVDQAFGGKPPQIPKIGYQTSWGQKYGSSGELGVELAAVWLTGGPLAKAMNKALPIVAASVREVSVFGVNIGPSLILAAKTGGVMLAGAELKQVYEDFTTLAADGSSEDEKHGALRRIMLTIVGAAAGGQAHNTGRNRPPNDTLPEARVHDTPDRAPAPNVDVEEPIPTRAKASEHDATASSTADESAATEGGAGTGAHSEPAPSRRAGTTEPEQTSGAKSKSDDLDANPVPRRQIVVRSENIRSQELSLDADAGTGVWVLYDEASGYGFCYVHVDGPGRGPELVLTPQEPRRFGNRNWSTGDTLGPEVLPVSPANFRWTDTALDRAEALYKAAFGRSVPNLDGQIAWKNKENFQRMFVKIRRENRGLTTQQAADLAIREISFGKARIRRGFTELSVDISERAAIEIDGQFYPDVPGGYGGVIDIKARRPGSTGGGE